MHTLWKSVLTVKLKVWLIVNNDLVMVPFEGRGHAYGWSYVHIYSELDSLRMVCLCQSVAPLWSGEKKTNIKITYLTVCLCTLCKSFSSLGYIHSSIFPPFCHPVRSPELILCGWLGSKHQLTHSSCPCVQFCLDLYLCFWLVTRCTCVRFFFSLLFSLKFVVYATACDCCRQRVKH